MEGMFQSSEESLMISEIKNCGGKKQCGKVKKSSKIEQDQKLLKDFCFLKQSKNLWMMTVDQKMFLWKFLAIVIKKTEILHLFYYDVRTKLKTFVLKHAKVTNLL